mmetsp:Transcript_4577/g.13216  ORF Transcript_4577/g.13216 Transcript_4577/m.13216 type:complete len:471 (+) Transcript_4577:731-2143(+)
MGFADRISHLDAVREIDLARVQVIDRLDAVGGLDAGIFVRRAELGTGRGLDHFPDVGLVHSLLGGHEPVLLVLVFTQLAGVRAHDAGKAPALGDPKNLGVRPPDLHDGFGRIDAGGPAPEGGRWGVARVFVFVGIEPGRWKEPIPVGVGRTPALVASTSVAALGPGPGVALRNELGAGCLELFEELGFGRDGALVNVLDDDPPGDPHKGWVRPGHCHGVVDVEFPDSREAARRQWLAVGHLETAEVVLGVLVHNVDHVFSVFVALLQSQDLVPPRIVAEFEGGRIFVDASEFIVVDVSRSTGARGLVVVDPHGADLVLALARRESAAGIDLGFRAAAVVIVFDRQRGGRDPVEHEHRFRGGIDARPAGPSVSHEPVRTLAGVVQLGGKHRRGGGGHRRRVPRLPENIVVGRFRADAGGRGSAVVGGFLVGASRAAAAAAAGIDGTLEAGPALLPLRRVRRNRAASIGGWR